jgi:hypothetical protein
LPGIAIGATVELAPSGRHATNNLIIGWKRSKIYTDSSGKYRSVEASIDAVTALPLAGWILLCYHNPEVLYKDILMLRYVSAAGLALTVVLAGPVQAGGLANEIVEPAVAAPAAGGPLVAVPPRGLFGGLGAPAAAGIAALAVASAVLLSSSDSTNSTTDTQ